MNTLISRNSPQIHLMHRQLTSFGGIQKSRGISTVHQHNQKKHGTQQRCNREQSLLQQSEGSLFRMMSFVLAAERTGIILEICCTASWSLLRRTNIQKPPIGSGNHSLFRKSSVIFTRRMGDSWKKWIGRGAKNGQNAASTLSEKRSLRVWETVCRSNTARRRRGRDNGKPNPKKYSMVKSTESFIRTLPLVRKSAILSKRLRGWIGIAVPKGRLSRTN